MRTLSHKGLADNLALWRAKIQTNTEESQTRNALLRKVRERLWRLCFAPSTH